MTVSNLVPVLESLSVAIFVINAERKIILANRAAETLFGDDLTGLDFVQAVRHPDCLAAIDKVLEGRNKAETVITLQHPVQTTYRVNVAGLSANASDPAEPRVVISFDDISHIREAEQMRSVFVANVSHELRSPLTALSGFIETLKGAAKNDEPARDRFLGIMEHEAQRMNRLIGDLLSLSKVEAGEHVRPDGVVNIVAIIEQVITVLIPQAKTANVAINMQVEENLHDRVCGDGDQLSQVFLNLVENAVKYGGSDSAVTIDIRRLDQAPGIRGAALAITTTDQGIGIAPEHIPRLTERFYRVDSGRSRKNGGTGLGLAIVKHILSRHRGRLQIKSKTGTGSAFTVFLPI